MYVVIFRAKARELDPEYATMAAQLRHRALEQFGCLAFHAVTEGADEIALSYWPDLDSIRTWKADAEHLVAQRLGRQRWYAAYEVQIAQVLREYRQPSGDRA